ncbi:ATP-binding protein [Rhodococcus sp. PD04]|uniref:ATP-binding protein n=1 Tax=Rhodococcus sp. PD04 TaxID=3109594 RepID=UPI002DDC1718|nr:ATP-binding protein [Rhodococcus sp. PD04]WSE25770.1 ATP-binding protein [Rhodococcus sp. PD04]
MAAWREHEIERTIGGTLDGDAMTEDSVRSLVRSFGHETELIDFKSKLAFEDKNANPTWNARQERAKDITMFANARGGLIVFGVEDESKEPDVEKRPQPFDSGDRHDLIAAFRKDVGDFARPIPKYDMFPVPAANPGTFYLVAVIPPSPQAPHAVIMQKGDNRRALAYFVRTDGTSHSRELEEYEVADRYRTRFRDAEERRQHADEVWSRGVERLKDGAEGLWLAVSVVPDVPGDSTLTRDARREISSWEDRQVFPEGVVGLLTPSNDSHFPAPGAVEFTQVGKTDDSETTPIAALTYRALHVDGSGFAAVRIAEHLADDSVTIVTEDLLIDALTACIPHLMAWTTDRIGQWGNATVSAALVDSAGTHSGFTKAVRIKDGGNGKVFGTRSAKRSRRPVAAADLAEAAAMQDKLTVVYSIAAELVQMFGLTEPALLTESGEIRRIPVLNERLRAVKEWAAHHRVPLDEASWPDSITDR